MILNQTELPDGWQLAPIRDITLRAPQKNPARNPASPFKYVDVSSVDNALCKITSASELIGSQAPSRARKEIRANDVLFATVRPTLRRIALVPDSLDGQIASTGYCVLRSNKELVSPEYLYFCVRTDSFVDAIGKLQRGANYPAVRDTDILRAQIPLPPINEQRKIAAVLGVVQKAIEEQERLIALTTELKKTLLHQLFTRGLHGEPQKETEIGLVPESWEVVPLEKVCKLVSGGTPSKQKPEFWLGSVPWVSPKDMKRPRLADVSDHISEAGLEDGSTLVPAGSVFVVIRGMILAKDVPVALAEVPMAFNQDMKAIIPTERISPDFLLYALTAFKANLFQKVGRSAHGTMTLMSSELEKFLIPLPAPETQQAIATAILAAEAKHEQHVKQREVLSDLFQTLLHQLMTARVRMTQLEGKELSIKGSGVSG